MTTWNKRTGSQADKRAVWNEAKVLKLDDVISAIAKHFPVSAIELSNDGKDLRSDDRFFPLSSAKK